MPLAEAFEDAVDRLLAGDIHGVRKLLRKHPDLAGARSERDHHATLLHYVAANGVEDERQKTPNNIVSLAQLLVDAGADPHATADFYGGGPGSTALASLVSSAHPAEAGVMDDLVRVFLSKGGNPNGLEDDGLPLATALLFRYPSAAHALVACGARVDNVASAAGLGSADLVEHLNGHLGADPGAYSFFGVDRRGVVELAAVLAAMAGETDALRALLNRGVPLDAAPRHGITPLHEAAYNGRHEVVRLLVGRGARADLRDIQHDSTAVGWAWHGQHRDICAWLVDHAIVDPEEAAAWRDRAR